MSGLRSAWVAKSIPNDIIIPDPTPKVTCYLHLRNFSSFHILSFLSCTTLDYSSCLPISPSQDYQDYTYNLIHLLCLPEMKIFLDTIRLLAGETDNLVDELWKYIKEKRVVETAVLLPAARGQIRGRPFLQEKCQWQSKWV
ncbi:hypothetical protein E2562_029541 [Oryza meyeriana var. granulata]|uniref:Uncharacterized protein n=1 Tax=Oryza meyeriana var. granulata TaxID=110450 RepID=A0A6G1FDS3_9ORYZ|nr:hypothetical protein E2562_029541 [Oryza meyeriana var. granulata]KAF0935022.1 hypothetical protein E2562_029541 [Oryza meyeriana var. granulata]